jgi:hypothetical protein
VLAECHQEFARKHTEISEALLEEQAPEKVEMILEKLRIHRLTDTRAPS